LAATSQISKATMVQAPKSAPKLFLSYRPSLPARSPAMIPDRAGGGDIGAGLM
jgi:hypothetical protein